MSRDPRIVVEYFPNEFIRTFHVSERIVPWRLYSSFSGVDALMRFSSSSIPPHNNPATVRTALSFYEIDGVVDVGLDAYEVRVTISLAFDWDDVTPKVLSLIKKHLYWDSCEVRNHDSRPAYGRGRQYGASDTSEDDDFGDLED